MWNSHLFLISNVYTFHMKHTWNNRRLFITNEKYLKRGDVVHSSTTRQSLIYIASEKRLQTTLFGLSSIKSTQLALDAFPEEKKQECPFNAEKGTA